MNSVTVVKSNDIIDASYRLTLNEQRLVLMCIAQIKKGQSITHDNKFLVSADEYAETFKLPLNNAYKELQIVADRLYERSATINKPDPENPEITHLKTRWINSIAYLSGKGELILSFSPDMIPYISMLEGRFTRYSIHSITGMTSIYGMRFYELMKKWMTESGNGASHKEVSIDELKNILDLKGKYKAIKDFKVKVLQPAIKDINLCSDLRASYTQRKTGRRVTHLIFHFQLDEQLKMSLKSRESTPKKLTNAYVEKHALPGETYAQAKQRLSQTRR